MPRHSQYLPEGVIPAVLLPFNDDLAIDEKSFRNHLRAVAATRGLSAVTVPLCPLTTDFTMKSPSPVPVWLRRTSAPMR